ncbi:hypothetical protein AMS68_000938 [Peltaster fructicola]|uniref:Uncharacterized protein n=1 Tax=Peltaster fructicola TaxID=286661 RepID=A0A6H0XLA8_9PEZI|nr:hypothetical protein AMS68_000938 [Peltaster fructicola]
MVPNKQQLEKMRASVRKTAAAAEQAEASPWSIAKHDGRSQESRPARDQAPVAQPSTAVQQQGAAEHNDSIGDHRASASRLTQQAVAAVEAEYGLGDTGHPYCLLRYLSTKQRHERLATGVVRADARHELAGQPDAKENRRNPL